MLIAAQRWLNNITKTRKHKFSGVISPPELDKKMTVKQTCLVQHKDPDNNKDFDFFKQNITMHRDNNDGKKLYVYMFFPSFFYFIQKRIYNNVYSFRFFAFYMKTSQFGAKFHQSKVESQKFPIKIMKEIFRKLIVSPHGRKFLFNFSYYLQTKLNYTIHNVASIFL